MPETDENKTIDIDTSGPEVEVKLPEEKTKEEDKTYESSEAGNWASVFGTVNVESPAPSGNQLSTTEDDNGDGSFDVSVGAEEFLNEFGGNAIKSPFQDGHYIYTVVAGGGSGQQSYSPILYIADLESPLNFNKKLQP